MNKNKYLINNKIASEEEFNTFINKKFTEKVYKIVADKDKILYYLNGKLHREDGPATEFANGDKEWYINGKLHREDGPAIEYNNGDKSWYINGKRINRLLFYFKYKK